METKTRPKAETFFLFFCLWLSNYFFRHCFSVASPSTWYLHRDSTNIHCVFSYNLRLLMSSILSLGLSLGSFSNCQLFYFLKSSDKIDLSLLLQRSPCQARAEATAESRKWLHLGHSCSLDKWIGVVSLKRPRHCNTHHNWQV